jgi:hypothetical protein
MRQHTSAYVSSMKSLVEEGSRADGTCSSSELGRREREYVSIRQHTSAYVSIRQHTSAYVSIRQHTSAYNTWSSSELGRVMTFPGVPSFFSLATPNTTCISHVSIRQHTSAYVSIRQHTEVRQHTSAYVRVWLCQILSAYHALHTSSLRPHTLVA